MTISLRRDIYIGIVDEAQETTLDSGVRACACAITGLDAYVYTHVYMV